MDIQEIQSRYDRLDGFNKALQTREKELEREITSLKSELEVLTKTSLVIKHLLDLMVKDEIEKMAGLVTYGLKTIFSDQDLSFKPVISKKNGKVYIELKTVNNGVEGEYGSFGGSVAVIESFLLRIIFMMKAKLARLLILDETFASIGWEYIESTSKLISELADKIGLDVLLVTHQKEFQNYAKHIYKVEESPTGLQMQRIK